MIDTIQYFMITDDKINNSLKDVSCKISKLDYLTGQIHYEINKIDTFPSWDRSIQLQIEDGCYRYDKENKKTIFDYKCRNVRLTCSIPKLLNGSNVVSLPFEKIIDGAYLLHYLVKKDCGVILPDVELWKANRIDLCSNYVLPSEQSVIDTINYFLNFDYPRRSLRRYENESGYSASRESTFKFYAKGKEYKKHDYKHVQHKSGEIEARRIYNKAKNILRVELEMRSKLSKLMCKEIENSLDKENVLSRVFSGRFNIFDILGYLNPEKILNNEIKKFFITTETRGQKMKDIYLLLEQNYGKKQAITYLAIYTMIITQGRETTKTMFSRFMLYRAIKAFRDCSISMVSLDRHKLILNSQIPEDFSFSVSENNKYYQMPLREVA